VQTPSDGYSNEIFHFVGIVHIEILDLKHRSCKCFWETHCKKMADLHPRQGNLLQRNNFSAVCKTSLHFAKYVGWRPAEKNLPVFLTCVFYVDLRFLWLFAETCQRRMQRLARKRILEGFALPFNSACRQGDQMRLWKRRPKCSPIKFFATVNK
jgi:hypothetical protein